MVSREQPFVLDRSREQKEKYTSKIELNFFRHGDKESDKTKSDDEIRLNESGRGQAVDRSVELKNPRLAKAMGSPRIRTQETAALVMLGKEKDMNPSEGAENVKEIASPGISNSPRIVEDDRLNFFLDEATESGKVALDNFKKGNYIKWLVENSDADAEKNGDIETNSSYAKSASGIASIIKDYVDASGRWDDIVKAEDTRKFPKGYAKELERFFGSHLGVTEAFLAKAVEKTKGVDERNKFIEALGNQGFKFVEGYKVDILNENGEVKVMVEYKKEDADGNVIFEFSEEIPAEMIDEIIEEGKLKDVKHNEQSIMEMADTLKNVGFDNVEDEISAAVSILDAVASGVVKEENIIHILGVEELNLKSIRNAAKKAKKII